MGRGTYMSAFKDGELAAAEEDVAAGCLGVWLCGLDGVISHVLGLIKHELTLPSRDSCAEERPGARFSGARLCWGWCRSEWRRARRRGGGLGGYSGRRRRRR